MGAIHWLKAATGVAHLCERCRLNRHRPCRRAWSGIVEEGEIVLGPARGFEAGAP